MEKFGTLNVEVAEETKDALDSLKRRIEIDALELANRFEEFAKELELGSRSSIDRYLIERDLQMQEKELNSRIGAYNAIIICLNTYKS